MKCERCNENEATIIAVQISNGKSQEIHICEKCAQEKGSSSFSIPISFQDFFQGILEIMGMDTNYEEHQDKEIKEPNCNICGMTFSEFKNTGRLGCENCYKTFKQLDTVLKNMQGSDKHLGKIPNRGRNEFEVKRELDTLKKQLAEAIKTEEFEEAAKLRDKIRELERK